MDCLQVLTAFQETPPVMGSCVLKQLDEHSGAWDSGNEQLLVTGAVSGGWWSTDLVVIHPWIWEHLGWSRLTV